MTLSSTIDPGFTKARLPKPSTPLDGFWYYKDMKLKPLNKYIHIKADEKDEKTAGGIYLVEELGSYPNTGVVLDYSINVFGEVNEGDHVFYSPYAAIELEDKTLLVPIDNVYAVIGDGNASSKTE